MQNKRQIANVAGRKLRRSVYRDEEEGLCAEGTIRAMEKCSGYLTSI